MGYQRGADSAKFGAAAGTQTYLSPQVTFDALDPRARPRVRWLQTKTMPTCKSCGDEAEELLTVKVAGKTKKLCESCADEVREQGEVAEASEAVVQNMMGFKGRR